ncbi:MAG: hypothetical protein ACI82I_001807, partial [Gammaproteobacteria bacterium]
TMPLTKPANRPINKAVTNAAGVMRVKIKSMLRLYAAALPDASSFYCDTFVYNLRF